MFLFKKLPWSRSSANPDPAVWDAVVSSAVFDRDWYVYRYPDVAAFHGEPIVHFCLYGLRELRCPSPHVSPAAYLRRSSSAQASALPAFLHALANVALADREEAWMPDDDPSLEYLIAQNRLFDEPWYVARNPDVARSGLKPMEHFLRHGAYEFRDPSAAFDTEFYRESFPDYQDRSRTPFEHFVRIGRRLGHAATGSRLSASPNSDVLETVTSSGLFDPVWYIHRYPDVAHFPGGPLVHFCKHGLEELRNPSPEISPANYLRRHPRARKSPLPAFLHALQNLSVEDREAAWMPDDDESLEYLVVQQGLFDEPWYVTRNPDVARSGLRPMRHFLQYGAYEFRDPSPAFDSEFYRDSHPDCQERCRTAIEHFARVGHRRGYPATGRPKYERWLAAFDVLTDGDVDRIRTDSAPYPVVVFHIIDAGAFERFDQILHAWSGQVGVDWSVRFTRGERLSTTAWDHCMAMVQGHANMSVVGNSDGLAGLHSGTVVLLCAGAVLVRPHSAYVLSHNLARPGAHAVYADHDHIDDAGVRAAPVFKPAMSPEFMRNFPYAGALIGALLQDQDRARIAAAIVAAAHGDADGAWANYLLDLPPGSVVRAPYLLFHRPGGAPHAIAGSDPTLAAQTISGAVDGASDDERTSVTIVIPTRDRCELLRACIDSIVSETDYPWSLVEINVVDNESEDQATLSYFAELRGQPGVNIVPSPGRFNFSRVCNDGAACAKGDVIVFLNNDTTVRQRNWLRKLVSYAKRPETGVVGARLLYPDGIVQHGGVVLGVHGVGAHRLAGIDGRQAERSDVTREMTSVTGACLAIRRDVFLEQGGLDPILQIAFNDVKLCASAYEAGYRNIYIGESLLYHHESKSRGFDDTRLKRHRNDREAIYVRERYGALFQNDPSYSPNLSLQTIDELASPPRIVRPWRRSPKGKRRVLLLSWVHGVSNGVATVLEQQAAFLQKRGWEVIVGGPTRDREITYIGCRRVGLWTAEAAAVFAVAEGVDCVIAHTPPFFSMTRYLGEWPLMYFMDHGEPPPRLFPDSDDRENIDWEKRFCASLARRVFTISQTVFRHQYRPDAIVIRNGNSHLAAWSGTWAEKRRALRSKLGFDGCFVVLNVCRFGPGERIYKGIGRYGEIASDAPFRHPELGGKARFILAGGGDDDDVADVEAMGLSAYANVTNDELKELYAASDLYLNLSEWEGYNLGIAQALAMGLHVIGSDIEAHREFDIELSDSIPDICAAVARQFSCWDEDAKSRRALLHAWDAPLTRLAETIELDAETADPQGG